MAKSGAGQTWAIFCRVVDFYGDAGFCWRLACALRDQGIGHVLLVIDRLDVLQAISGKQQRPGVSVMSWQLAEERWQSTGIPVSERADVVIEAFACDPPEVFLASLSDKARWITLDYLATEPWADGVHLMPSPSPRLTHPAAAHRQWFIPGFSTRTGGLLHGRWRHISQSERRAWRKILAGRPIADDVFLIMGFGYPDADWDRLMTLANEQLPKGFKEVHIWKPQGIAFSQSEFDEILQACDLNFVRGEDSFVRAHWASAGPWKVPFVWQPYRQEGDAHATKLAGWLAQIYGGLRSNGSLTPSIESLTVPTEMSPPLAPLVPLFDLHWAWNRLPCAGQYRDLRLAWEDLVSDFHGCADALHRSCLRLALRPGLESLLKAALKG